MNNQRMGWTFLVVCVFATGVCSPASSGESNGPPTLGVRLEFLRGYHSWSPRERREATNLLTLPQYRGYSNVGAALHDMALFDKDPEIRLASFVALCGWHDRDGRLAWRLARLFKLELEVANKPRMAQAMTQLKFKTDALNSIITYAFSPGVNYPNIGGSHNYGYRWSGGRGGADWWESANFKTLLEAINTLSGKNFVPANYTSGLVLNWWRLNAIDYQEDDRKLARQIRETGGPAQVLAAVAREPERPTDSRLAEMFERLARDGAEAQKKAPPMKDQNPPTNEEDLE